MNHIRKIIPLSFFICLSALMLCLNGAFASAAYEEEYALEFYELQEILAEKWAPFEKLDLDSEWITGYRLPENVYVFLEMPYEQDVCCFLIPGKEKALLLDTGTGLASLRPLVEKLTDLPVIVLNSHDDFDHIGGNAEFDEVWCYDTDSAVSHLTTGPTEEEMAELTKEMQFISTIMDTSSVTVPDRIPGKAPTGTVKDGQIIDLGERSLEVLYTPGHDSSSLMLLDLENRLLFTGDMYSPVLSRIGEQTSDVPTD